MIVPCRVVKKEENQRVFVWSLAVNLSRNEQEE